MRRRTFLAGVLGAVAGAVVPLRFRGRPPSLPPLPPDPNYDVDAFGRAMELEMKGLAEDFRQDLERQLWTEEVVSGDLKVYYLNGMRVVTSKRVPKGHIYFVAKEV